MIAEKRRIEEIDILRGIAAVLMILGHSFIKYPVNISDIPWCSSIGHFIYTFHMELFFLLAGVVYRCRDYKKFIIKKAKRLLIPYLFFGVFTLILKAFGGAAINGIEPLDEGIYDLVFHGGNYWFLYTLFLLFFIYPYVEKICNTEKKKFLLLILLLAAQYIMEPPEIFKISSLISHATYFILGNCLADYLGERHIIVEQKTLKTTIAVGVFMVLDLLEILTDYQLRAGLRFVRAIAIIYVFYVIAIWIINAAKEKLIINKIKLILCESSKYSLQLYLFNGYLMTALRIFICQICGITMPLLIVLGIWIGNIVVTLILCKYVIPRIKIVKVLCGL